VREINKATAKLRSHCFLRIDKDIMDESVQKSCWGVTAKAVIGFAVIILLAWLMSGAETAAVLGAR